MEAIPYAIAAADPPTTHTSNKDWILPTSSYLERTIETVPKHAKNNTRLTVISELLFEDSVYPNKGIEPNSTKLMRHDSPIIMEV